MGWEYRIKFAVPQGYSSEALERRLPSKELPGSAWHAYDFATEPTGFYFLDHSRTEAASHAFRLLVDEALALGPPVVIEEV